MWSEVAQLCPTLCNPMDGSPPGSYVHGIFQARILEWVAISFSGRSSQPRDRTQVSSASFTGRCHWEVDSLPWATWEASSKHKCLWKKCVSRLMASIQLSFHVTSPKLILKLHVNASLKTHSSLLQWTQKKEARVGEGLAHSFFWLY